MPYTANGRSAYLFTFRTEDNVHLVYYADDASRSALAKADAVRSFTARTLKRAQPTTR